MPDGWVRVALTLSLAPIPSLAYLARSVIMMVINFMMRVMISIMRLNRSSNKTLILDIIGFEICIVDVLISITTYIQNTGFACWKIPQKIQIFR